MPFDMPPASAGFPARGRWVINQLMTDLSIGIIPAAGIVGNLGFESTGFTQLHEIGQPDGVGGYGWGQWTAARRTTFFNWCDGKHLAWASDEANYGYLVHELTTNNGLADGQAWVLTHVKACVNLEGPSGSVFVFGRYYESPGGTTNTYLPGYDGRLRYAKQAMASPSPSVPPPVPVPTVAIPSARDLQAALAAVGLYTGIVDGIWGTHSQQALAAFYAGHQS